MTIRRLVTGIVLAFTSQVLLAQQPPSAPAFPWPDGRQAALSLSFDDARASQIQVGTPLLDRHGVKATFYIVPATAERQIEGWKRAAASGHELASHSLDHRCSGNFPFSRAKALEEYSLEAMRKELTEAISRIETLFGVRPESFAYPCGQSFVGRGVNTQSYVPVAASLHVTARGWLDEAPNDPSYVDFAQLTGIESDGKEFADILPIVEAAKKTGMWVVLAGHDIGEGGRQTTRVRMLEALSAYATDPKNGVWIAPVGVVARYVRDRRGPR